MWRMKGCGNLQPSQVSMHSATLPWMLIHIGVHTSITSHMTHEHWVCNYEHHCVPIWLANNNIVHLVDRDVIFKLEISGQLANEATFPKVLHVPALKNNLFTVLHLTSHNNFTVNISKGHISFLLRDEPQFCDNPKWDRILKRDHHPDSRIPEHANLGHRSTTTTQEIGAYWCGLTWAIAQQRYGLRNYYKCANTSSKHSSTMHCHHWATPPGLPKTENRARLYTQLTPRLPPPMYRWRLCTRVRGRWRSRWGRWKRVWRGLECGMGGRWRNRRVWTLGTDTKGQLENVKGQVMLFTFTPDESTP